MEPGSIPQQQYTSQDTDVFGNNTIRTEKAGHDKTRVKEEDKKMGKESAPLGGDKILRGVLIERKKKEQTH